MGEAAAKEPTMEDILSSIRRIIAQDDQPQQTGDATGQTGADDSGGGRSEAARGAGDGGPEGKRPAQPALDRPGPPQAPARPAIQGSAPPRKPEGNIGELAALAGEITGTKAQSPGAPLRPAGQNASPPAMTAQRTETKPASVLAGSSASGQMGKGTASAPGTSAPGTSAPGTSAPGTSASGAAPHPAPASGAEPKTAARPGEFKSAIVDVEEPARAKPMASARPGTTAPSAGSGANMPRSDNSGRAATPGPRSNDREARNFKQALVSPSTEGAVSGSMDRLKKAAIDDAEARVESVLRPMLREWLDDNLPDLVERLVREEISRIASDG